MADTILYVTGEGVGNVIQTLPTIAAIEKVTGLRVDILLTKTNFPIERNLFSGDRKVFYLEDLKAVPNPEKWLKDRYVGKVLTIWGWVHTKEELFLAGLPTMNSPQQQHMSYKISEVEVYMRAARELGARPKDEFYDVRSMFDLEDSAPSYPVLIANGYNFRNEQDMWWAKSYERFPKVVQLLKAKGLAVCSVGAPREYVKGTNDFTGLSLRETVSLASKATVILCTATAMYHIGAALRRPVVSLFTFSNTNKNRHSKFHATTTILTTGVKCQATCQQNLRWKKCPRNYVCRAFDPAVVAKTVCNLFEKIK